MQMHALLMLMLTCYCSPNCDIRDAQRDGVARPNREPRLGKDLTTQASDTFDRARLLMGSTVASVYESLGQRGPNFGRTKA